MSDVEYALRRTPEEYERLRAQARMWEAATGRLLDQARPGAGTRCLDAGCGPGETMRLMAMRVGPNTTVTGIEVDAALAATAERSLHADGHRQCRVLVHDLSSYEPIPGGPYDLVLARLLLLHLPDRVAVLRRLWESVAEGGHLLVQDYDMAGVGSLPTLASAEEVSRVLLGTFTAVGCDVRTGMALPTLLAEAGIGEPDGTDVAGRLEPLGTAARMLEQTFRSLLPAALAHGVTDTAEAERTLAALARDAARHPGRPVHWPLMIGVWKRR
jgi:SAM-dependent methyltransferase